MARAHPMLVHAADAATQSEQFWLVPKLPLRLMASDARTVAVSANEAATQTPDSSAWLPPRPADIFDLPPRPARVPKAPPCRVVPNPLPEK